MIELDWYLIILIHFNPYKQSPYNHSKTCDYHTSIQINCNRVATSTIKFKCWSLYFVTHFVLFDIAMMINFNQCNCISLKCIFYLMQLKRCGNCFFFKNRAFFEVIFRAVWVDFGFHVNVLIPLRKENTKRLKFSRKLFKYNSIKYSCIEKLYNWHKAKDHNKRNWLRKKVAANF